MMNHHPSRTLRAFLCLLAALPLAHATGLGAAAPDQSPTTDVAPPPIIRESRMILGWTLHIHRDLLRDQVEPTAQALELLERQLSEILRVVPAPAVEELKKVPLYFSPEDPGGKPGAAFHPNRGWLVANGRDPIMTEAVEFTNIRIFAAEVRRMPNFVLHELAHAYHFRTLPKGFGNVEIKAAYDRAKSSGSYQRVERWLGNGKPNTFESAYAMSNPMEYFAETTEAYFCRNDFFPFTREELKQHDPDMAALVERLWNLPAPTKPAP